MERDWKAAAAVGSWTAGLPRLYVAWEPGNYAVEGVQRAIGKPSGSSADEGPPPTPPAPGRGAVSWQRWGTLSAGRLSPDPFERRRGCVPWPPGSDQVTPVDARRGRRGRSESPRQPTNQGGPEGVQRAIGKPSGRARRHGTPESRRGCGPWPPGTDQVTKAGARRGCRGLSGRPRQVPVSQDTLPRSRPHRRQPPAPSPPQRGPGKQPPRRPTTAARQRKAA